jgi:hypothetical protein
LIYIKPGGAAECAARRAGQVVLPLAWVNGRYAIDLDQRFAANRAFDPTKTA